MMNLRYVALLRIYKSEYFTLLFLKTGWKKSGYIDWRWWSLLENGGSLRCVVCGTSCQWHCSLMFCFPDTFSSLPVRNSNIFYLSILHRTNTWRYLSKLYFHPHQERDIEYHLQLQKFRSTSRERDIEYICYDFRLIFLEVCFN